MPVISLGNISTGDFQKRMTEAHDAYLEDRFDDSVTASVNVFLDLVRDNPDALAGTRLDRTNRFGQWPDYGITLADQGTPQVHSVNDGRKQTMASAVCYYEFVLEAVILAQGKSSSVS